MELFAFVVVVSLMQNICFTLLNKMGEKILKYFVAAVVCFVQPVKVRRPTAPAVCSNGCGLLTNECLSD